MNKQEDYLAGKQEIPFQGIQMPAQLQYTRDLNGLPLLVDAVITVPAASQYSVAEVKKVQFSIPDYTEMIEYFIGDAALYKETPQTRQAIAEQIILMETVLEAGTEQDYADLEPILEYLKSKFESAPAAVSEYPSFSLSTDYTGSDFMAYGSTPSGDMFCVGASNSGNFVYVRDNNMAMIPQDALTEDDEEWADYAGDFPIQAEDAIQIGNQVIADLGISDMTLDTCVKACGYRYWLPAGSGAVSKAWHLAYTRDNYGLQTRFSWLGGTIWNADSVPAAGAPWDSEVIIIIVDENGLLTFNWRGAGKQSAVLRENVALLPFAEMLERMEKQLMYQHLFEAKDDTAPPIIEVYEIRLCAALVSVPNSQDTGRVIPAWEVLYNLTFPLHDGSIGRSPNITYFNAIDGSYIEPRITMGTIASLDLG